MVQKHLKPCLSGTGAGRGHKTLSGHPSTGAGLDGRDDKGGGQSKGAEPNKRKHDAPADPIRL